MTIAGNVSSLVQNINAYVADRAMTDPVGPAGDTALLKIQCKLFTK